MEGKPATPLKNYFTSCSWTEGPLVHTALVVLPYYKNQAQSAIDPLIYKRPGNCSV